MVQLNLLVVLACLAVALAEPRVPQRGVIHQIQRGVAGPNPYIFLTVPKGRSQTLVQGFEVIEENDNKKHALDKDNEEDEDEEADNDDEDMPEDNDDEDQKKLYGNVVSEEDEEEDTKDTLPNNFDEDMDADKDDDDELDNVMAVNLKLRKSKDQIKNAKLTQMMVSREHANAIMVPDEIIEIEGQSVIDEKTGKPVLLLPRAVLDSINAGSIVAIMARSADDVGEARANRVIVRRRRKDARINIKRRRSGNQRHHVIRHSSNKRSNNNRRKNVRIVRGGNSRHGNKRHRVSLQG